MSELWHLRIHLHESVSSTDIYTFIAKRCEVIICVFEQHDNRPHLHILFKETDVTKSTIIQNLVKQYPWIKGNGSYSCSKTDKLKKKKVGDDEKGDDEKAKCYVCKGANKEEMPIVVGKCLIDYKDYHFKYWQVNAELTEKVNMDCQNGSSLVTKAKSKTKTWSERTYDEIRKKYEVECNTIITYYQDVKPSDVLVTQYDLSRRIIFRYMMKCLGQNVKKINENIIRDLWSGFMNSIIQSDEISGQNYSDKLFNALIFKH